MKDTLRNCIYCTDLFNPTGGEGDHVLPSAIFGLFKNDQQFRGCCPSCNNSIGRHEQQIGRTGPEGYFRNIVKPGGRRRKKGKTTKQGPAMGAPAPLHTMQLDGIDILVESCHEDPRIGVPQDQLVVILKDGGKRYFKLFPKMTPETLHSRIRSELGEADFSSFKSYYVNCDEKRRETFQSLVGLTFPDTKISADWTNEVDEHRRVPSRHIFSITESYFQALAKIAFHHYLIHNRRGYRGDERNFEEIRDFIQNGGDRNQIFKTPSRRFITPYGTDRSGMTLVPSNWCHVIAANESEGPIEVCLYLFLGPEHVPEPTCVTLGNTLTRDAVTDSIWGHVFQYNDSVGGRYDGEVTQVSITRLR